MKKTETVTLKDVAQSAGVSAMAASYALRNQPGVSDATRTRVLRVADKLNYHVNPQASALKSGRNGTIGILIDNFDEPFWSKLIAHIYDAATRQGVLPIFQQVHAMHDKATEGLISSQGFGQYCDGIIVSTGGLSAEEVHDLANGKPIVLIGYEGRANVLSAVNPANEDASHAAVEHLIAQGCRHIGLVGLNHLNSSELMMANSTPDKRTRGAMMALIEHGLDHTPDQFFPCAPDETGGMQAAPVIASAIRKDPESIDGLFCDTDILGVGLLRGLFKEGIRVPQDVKVIGFDGSRPGQFCVPSLSTVAIDYAQLAENAVSLLLRAIEHGGSDTPTKVTVGFTLEARESTQVV